MNDIYSLTPEKAVKLLLRNGLRQSQADNIFRDIYKNGAQSFEQMSLCSSRVIQALEEFYEFPPINAEQKLESDTTVKYLFRLSDGNMIEAVLMRQKYSCSVCISTQCGCNMGCKFCCSGRLKKIRDLTAGEMVRQLVFIEKDQGIKIGNVTVMGIGEPFDNFENLCGFLDIISYPHGMEIGARHITVSTCGIVPKIDESARCGRNFNLAVSLHAPDDELRNELMPINRRYHLNELIGSAARFAENRNRKVLLEYVMLKGVNDSREQALQLAKLIGKRRLFVNIIPYNTSPDSGFERSPREAVLEFYDELKKHGIGVTVRREFGGDLSAACGQLRSDRIKQGD